MSAAAAVPYEKSEVEYDSGLVIDYLMRPAPPCIRCGRDYGMHWRTEDGKTWCLRDAPTVSEKPHAP